MKPQAMLLTESALAVRIGQYDDTTILTSVIPADTSKHRVDVFRSCAVFGPGGFGVWVSGSVRQPGKFRESENP